MKYILSLAIAASLASFGSFAGQSEFKGRCFERIAGLRGDNYIVPATSNDEAGLKIVYRRNENAGFYFLLKNGDNGYECPYQQNVVLDVLTVPLEKNSETLVALNGDCSTPDGRVKKGDLIVGFFPSGSLEPTKAWRADQALGKFGVVYDVTCRSFQ